MLVVNLYGGPGTGKSTTAAGVFSELKLLGINAELATEYAKDKVWERSENVLANQIYVLGKQYHRLWRLQDQVDVVVTDSPLLLGLVYGKNESRQFKSLVADLYNRFDNYDVFLTREKEFNPSGRLQTESKAKQLDQDVYEMLTAMRGQTMVFRANKNAIGLIATGVIEWLIGDSI